MESRRSKEHKRPPSLALQIFPAGSVCYKPKPIDVPIDFLRNASRKNREERSHQHCVVLTQPAIQQGLARSRSRVRTMYQAIARFGLPSPHSPKLCRRRSGRQPAWLWSKQFLVFGRQSGSLKRSCCASSAQSRELPSMQNREGRWRSAYDWPLKRAPGGA